MLRKLLPEIVVLLDEARVRRDQAARLRQESPRLTDARSWGEMEATALDLELEAAKLEAHAAKFQLLANRTDRLIADIQREMQKAKDTITEMKKKLTST
jgi:hypothetical protein